jgi:hypothetical protein
MSGCGKLSPPLWGRWVALIGGAGATLEQARQLVEAAPEEAMVDRSAVTLLTPIPVLPQIRDFLAFEQHLKGALAMAERLTGRHVDIPAASAVRSPFL